MVDIEGKRGYGKDLSWGKLSL